MLPIFAILYIACLFIEYQRLTRKQFEGELLLKRQKKNVYAILLILLGIASIGYFINGKINHFQFIVLSLAVLLDLYSSILTYRLKPITICIKGNKIQLNNWWKTSRNLKQLKAISLNGFTDYIIMEFFNESPILFKYGEYLHTDIEKLILICHEMNGGNFFVSENLRTKMPDPTFETDTKSS